MRFAIVFCIVALATLAYSQPLVDTVKQIQYPSKAPVSKPEKESDRPAALKPVKEPMKPTVLKPVKKPVKPIVSKPVKEPVRPSVSTSVNESVTTTPIVKPVTEKEEKPQKLESIVENIIENHRPKPEVDTFNGKVVPTPKYPTKLNH